MKVSVITRHAITNYGSLLQTFATQKMIESLGYDCEIIDYIREDESYKQLEKTLLKRKDGWNNNPIKKAFYLAVRQPASIFSGKRFEKYRKDLLNLSERYTTQQSLKNNPPKADIYMTGSDQVWGPIGNGTYDDCYCLSFVKNKKIAYASSFGHIDMKEETQNYYKRWLQEYSDIAVREDSAVDFLNRININAKQVLDPTLLFDKSFWGKYTRPIKNKKYILVYQLHNNKRLENYAKRIAMKKGLPLMRVSVSYHQFTRAGKLVLCPGWGEFLSYIKNAELMITDSFHGTAFAINFNTHFIEVLPNNNTESRNISILNLTKLNDRVLKDENDVSLADKKIDFSSVNAVIEEQRQKSITILKEMLKL